jgi:DNA-binding MarR family transcriptional regulator
MGFDYMPEYDLDTTLSKLKNPRMSAGRIVLYSLLGELQGDPISPGKVRGHVDSRLRDRDISKQSITNAARRLEEAGIITRTEGYSVNYGYLISILLHTVMELTDSVSDLEEEVAELKASSN